MQVQLQQHKAGHAIDSTKTKITIAITSPAAKLITKYESPNFAAQETLGSSGTSALAAATTPAKIIAPTVVDVVPPVRRIGN